MTDVLFIIPPFNYGDMNEAGPIYPSMGLVFVSAVLEQAGYNVKLYDMFALGLDEKVLGKLLEDKNLKVAGVTAVSATFKTSYEILKNIKKIRPDITTIIGGPHVTILPEKTMQEEHIDYGVMGEGDYTALELIDYIIKGAGRREDIKGIAYRDEEGRVVQTERRPFIENLDELPFPAYHLLPMDKYKPYGVYDSGRKTAAMITSRGCPFKCIFCCSSKIFGGRWRPMSAEKTIENIKRLCNEFGVRHIYFEDDEFTVSHERVMKICDGIIESKLDLNWECLTRVSHVDDELLAKMAKAGCKGILYGVEVGYDEGLKNIRKGITLEQARNAIKLTQKHGMIAKAAFIIGFPWEGEKEVKQTIDFAAKLNADYPFFFILNPFPTTDVYETIKKEGLFIPGFNVDMYCAQPALESLIRTRYLTSEELIRLMGYGYKKIYFNPRYLFRQLRRQKHFSELKRNVISGMYLLIFTVKLLLTRDKPIKAS